MTKVCGDPHAIDAQWMTEALEESGVAQGATVTDLVLEGFIGTGQMGRNARYSLAWDNPKGRPSTVVGKFPAEDATARAAGFSAGPYIKEWIFYSQLADTVQVSKPDCYVARFDGDAEEFVLIMEDISGSVQGDQMRGLTVAEAMLGVEQAVAFHAPHWGNDELETILGQNRQDLGTLLDTLYNMMFEGCIERLGAVLDDDMAELIRAVAPAVGTWWSEASGTRTMVHADYRPDNMMFGASEGAPALVIVDWQTLGYGLGATDIAYMIGGSFEPEERRNVERDLVAAYGQQLRAAGVDYSDEECWDDYVVSTLWGVILTVLATMMAEQTERGDKMLGTMLYRHCRHALDLGALATQSA